MSYRNAKKSGFTLVEILIVVVILGILAAIVIPQFTNASQAAKASQLTAQLQTLRSQLELAQIEHQGEYPVLAGNDAAAWTDLTTPTERDTAYTADDSVSETPVAGPYLQKPPVNSFFNASPTASQISIGATNATAWVYDQANGTIRASASALNNATDASDLGLDVYDATTNPNGDVEVP